MTAPPDSCCPLCRGDKITAENTVQIATLERLYHRLIPGVDPFTGWDVEHLELLRCDDCDLGFFRPANEGDAEFYDALSKLPWYYLPEKREYEIARRFVQNGNSVLDIGCGSGSFSSYIRHASFSGVDINPAAVEVARATGLDVEQALLSDFSGLGSQSFDVVCGFQAIEHLTSPIEFLENACGCIVPGGFLVLSVPCADSFISLELNEPLNLPPHHLTWWSDVALRNVADVVSLDLVMLDHEVLGDRFRRRYATALVEEVLRRWLHREKRIVDTSFTSVALKRIAALVGRPIASALTETRLAPRGHSVTAVYRKRPAN